MNDPEFTGERFIPGQGGVGIAYEHLHRYIFASRLSAGKTVLDVACGSGYGAAMLSAMAERVFALDMDIDSVRQASAARGGGVGFVAADAQSLPFASRSVDAVTAFEVVEHVPEPESLVKETARVVRPDGTVFISTPNKAVYSDARDYRNPYHLREFYPGEFLEMLRRHFPFVRDMRQHIRAGSLIEALSACSGAEVVVGPEPAPGLSRTEPMYVLAVCGFSEEAVARASTSAYLDPTDGLFAEWESRFSGALVEIARLNSAIAGLGEWGRELERRIAERDEALRAAVERGAREAAVRDEAIRGLQEELRREVRRRDDEITRLGEVVAGLHAELDSRARWAHSLEEEARIAGDQLKRTEADLRAVGDHLARIRHAFLYRVLCRLGILPK